MAGELDRCSRREALRAIGAASLLGGAMAWADEPQKSVPEEIVDTMNQLFGRHPGFRAVHAKGIVTEGEFMPSSAASTLSRAPHFQGEPVRVTARFSDGTGLPDIPDGVPDAGPRGLAVKFHLPETSTDIVANAYNGFAVSTPEEFLAFLRALAETSPNAPKPTPIEKFLAEHPKALKVAKAPKPAPVSFATEPYFSVNAFVFTNKEGKTRAGRYQLRPEAAEAYLTPEEAAKEPATYLIDELGPRLAKGPVSFRLVVQLAAAGDPVDDATEVWPEDRPLVELGVVKLTKLAADNDAA
jgi:catalase